MGRHLARPPRRAFTRVRAVLAGALVLGVGGTATLASWTDTEFASGSFTASKFDTESSVNGTSFASNPTSPGVSFAAQTGMSPLVSKYVWLDVRTTTDSTAGGTMALAATARTMTAGNLTEVLEYRIVRTTTSITCAAAAFTDTNSVYVAGANSPTVTYVTAGSMPGSTPSASLSSAQGNTLRYCVEVRIKSGAANSYQGKGGTLEWSFSAISS